MLWFFLIFSTLAWGIAEIYYKKGNIAHEKYAHLKTTCFVGIFMGIYALVILLSQGLLSGPDGFKNFLINIVRYLPVSACYIISMTCSYFGVRFGCSCTNFMCNLFTSNNECMGNCCCCNYCYWYFRFWFCWKYW